MRGSLTKKLLKFEHLCVVGWLSIYSKFVFRENVAAVFNVRLNS